MISGETSKVCDTGSLYLVVGIVGLAMIVAILIGMTLT